MQKGASLGRTGSLFLSQGDEQKSEKRRIVGLILGRGTIWGRDVAQLTSLGDLFGGVEGPLTSEEKRTKTETLSIGRDSVRRNRKGGGGRLF